MNPIKLLYIDLFYGTVDPMVVTCALRDFIADRNNIAADCEQAVREQREAEERKSAITYEQWLKLKQKDN